MLLSGKKKVALFKNLCKSRITMYHYVSIYTITCYNPYFYRSLDDCYLSLALILLG